MDPQANAATRVFATPELLETILLNLAHGVVTLDQGHHLEPITTLCRVQRASTAFRATILGSPSIQNLMNFAAPSSTDHRLCPALKWLFETQLGPTLHLHFYADAPKPWAMTTFKALPPGAPPARSGNNLIHSRTTAFTNFRTQYAGADASWRLVQICKRDPSPRIKGEIKFVRVYMAKNYESNSKRTKKSRKGKVKPKEESTGETLESNMYNGKRLGQVFDEYCGFLDEAMERRELAEFERRGFHGY